MASEQKQPNECLNFSGIRVVPRETSSLDRFFYLEMRFFNSTFYAIEGKHKYTSSQNPIITIEAVCLCMKI